MEGPAHMSDRRSIVIPGLSHLTAIPVATRIGPLVVSSVIAAFNPGTRDVPDTIEAQIANIFSHVGAMLEAAGAAWDNVAKMSFWVAEPAHRAALDSPWLERFPDERSGRRATRTSPGARPWPRRTSSPTSPTEEHSMPLTPDAQIKQACREPLAGGADLRSGRNRCRLSFTRGATRT